MGASCTKAGREEAALLRAAKDGDCLAVQQAILRDVEWSCKAQTWNGQNVFHLAARYGRIDVLETVVEAVRFNPVGPDKWEKLLRMGHSTDALLCAFVNLKDARFQTPLHLASIYGHHEVAERLLQLGATPWAWDELGGRTPVHYAASMGHVDVIRVIISHNAPAPTGEALRRPNSPRTRLVDICNDSGYTPLHYAVWAGNAASVRALVSFEASLSARNIACGSDWVVSCLKCTPLHLAAHKGNQAIVKLLLSAYVQYQPPQGSEGPSFTDRRRRDPRRHVNANRQLPYHVAVSRNHNHLTEMLHPDVPFSFILTPAEMESRLYGVPRLAALAAKVLQAKLVDDIEAAITAMAAVTPVRGTLTSLAGSGALAFGGSRGRSGSLAALSGAVVAAATGQATSSAVAAQQVLAAATAQLRSVNERSVHGGTLVTQASEAAGTLAAVPPPPSQQQRSPSTNNRLPAAAAAAAGPAAVGAAPPQPVAMVVAGPPVSAAAEGACADITATVVEGTTIKPFAPSDKSSATSAGEPEREAPSFEPAPLRLRRDLAASRPAAAGEGGPATLPPALPLPPAPISPFLPALPSTAASGGAAAADAGPAGGRVPTFNEAASAFALFAAEPFDEAAGGGGAGGGGQAPQHSGSSSVSLAMFARSRALQAASGALLAPASSNSISIAVLARTKIALGGTRGLQRLLTGSKNRRRNSTSIHNADASAAPSSSAGQLQQQQEVQAAGSELSSVDDIVGDAGAVLDDLDDILNAMQPPEDTESIMRGKVMVAPAVAAAAAAAASGPSEEAAAAAGAAPSSGRPSVFQASPQSARCRGSSGGSSMRPFWRRSSTQVPPPSSVTTGNAMPTPQATREASCPYNNGSLHAGHPATIATAPSEALASSGMSTRARAPSLPLPAPPGVIESRAPTETSAEVDSRCVLPAAIRPSANFTPIESIGGDSDAVLPSVNETNETRFLRGSSISLAALARGGAEAVLSPQAPAQEQVDGAVLAMLASLVEAPQNVLRRYRLLQLTHGLDLQDILRDHSEQAAAAATAAAGPGTGSARPSGGEGLLLTSVGSDALRTAAPAAVAALFPCASVQITAAGSVCPPPAWSSPVGGAGENSLYGGNAPAAAAAGAASALAAAASTGTGSCGGGARPSVDAACTSSPRQVPLPTGDAATPFAQDGAIPAALSALPSNGSQAPGAGPANAMSANLAGQLLRTLSSAAASESGEGTCGVCFDQPDVLSITGCGHRLCADCSRELCKLNTLKPALCPFCRGMIGGFKYIGRS